MTEFNDMQWAKPGFTQVYRDNADIFIVERKRLFEILKSFYKHFISHKPKSKVLDLGCGDGIIVYELLKVDNTIEATLIDGSKDMLNKAMERLNGFGNHHFIRASFQDIIEENTTLQKYDFIVSSMAIHHLTMGEKTSLFETIYSHLKVDGYFLNIDATLAPSDALEEWYQLLWKQWIEERISVLGLEAGHYDEIARKFKDNTDDKPDTLAMQLKALQTIGFKNTDCFYKYGIFTMFGGKK